MIESIGVHSIDHLIEQTIPNTIRLRHPLNLPTAQSENDFLVRFKKLSDQNQIYKSYIGTGYYDCITPSVILRNILIPI